MTLTKSLLVTWADIANLCDTTRPLAYPPSHRDPIRLTTTEGRSAPAESRRKIIRRRAPDIRNLRIETEMKRKRLDPLKHSTLCSRPGNLTSPGSTNAPAYSRPEEPSSTASCRLARQPVYIYIPPETTQSTQTPGIPVDSTNRENRTTRLTLIRPPQ